MAVRRIILPGVWLALAWVLGLSRAAAQGPLLPGSLTAQPGSTASSLGPTPGAGGSPFGFLPGAGEMILGGRPGTSSPRVPTSISIPGRVMGGAAAPLGIAAPRPLPITTLPVYGPLALPSANED